MSTTAYDNHDHVINCIPHRDHMIMKKQKNDIRTHSSVSAAKKAKDAQHTSVLFTGAAKLPNSAFCISKTTKLISTKFIYFLPYIYTTSHIKIEGNRFSSS